MRNELNETTIDGYLVELTLFEEDGEQRSFCHVTKGRFNGSLALLSGNGVLENADGSSFLAVNPNTIEKIERWADDNGY